MRFENDKIICEGVVAEAWVLPLKNYLEGIAPAKIYIDFTKCIDVHTAIAQLLISYAGIYEIDYEFPQQNYAYKYLLQGAKVVE